MVSVHSSFSLSSLVVKWLLGCCLLFLTTACGNKMPEGIPDEGTMENLLYDYHLAQAMAERSAQGKTPYETRYYETLVFQKYGLSRTDFDRSMQWYMRHTEILFEIYERIDKRLAAIEASSQGSFTTPKTFSEKGDTANIWKAAPLYLLNARENNRMAFVIEADTSFHAGDRFEWSFDIGWMYREGVKSAAATLFVRYTNDSVAIVSQTIFGSGRQKITLQTRDKKIKSVEGFIYQSAVWKEPVQLMMISNFSLLKVHLQRSPSMTFPVQLDSVEVQEKKRLQLKQQELRIQDSLLRNDRPTGSHFK